MNKEKDSSIHLGTHSTFIGTPTKTKIEKKVVLSSLKDLNSPEKTDASEDNQSNSIAVQAVVEKKEEGPVKG